MTMFGEIIEAIIGELITAKRFKSIKRMAIIAKRSQRSVGEIWTVRNTKIVQAFAGLCKILDAHVGNVAATMNVENT